MTKLFGPRVKSDEEIAEDAAIKADVQRESDLKNPATGSGISVKEAAHRLGFEVGQVEQMIAEGTFESSRRDVDRTGENEQYWVSGVEVFEMSNKKVNYTDTDLH